MAIMYIIIWFKLSLFGLSWLCEDCQEGFVSYSKNPPRAMANGSYHQKTDETRCALVISSQVTNNVSGNS